MFYEIAITFFCVNLSAVLNSRPCRSIRPHPTFDKTHFLLPLLQVHLQLLLDHLAGYFNGLVLGGLTVSDGVRGCLDLLRLTVGSYSEGVLNYNQMLRKVALYGKTGPCILPIQNSFLRFF